MFNLLPGMDDDQKMLIAASLLQGQGNFGANLSQGLMGSYAHKQGKAFRDMERVRLQQMQDQVAQEEKRRGLAKTAFAPGQEVMGVQPDGVSPTMAGQGGGIPDYVKGLLGMGDVQGAVGLQTALQKQGPKYHTVGGALVPEPTVPGQKTQPVYEAPQDQWVDVGRDPKTNQVIQKNARTGQMKAVGMMPSQVNVDNRLENREQGDKGALNVKNFGEIQQAAGSARKENSMLSALARNPIQTSAAAPLTSTAAAWLSAAGLGGDQVKQIASNAQQFNAVAKDLVLQKQLAQKGPQTESDARRLEQTVASLGNTPESNAAIIAFSMAQNNRTIQQERFYSDWWKKHKTYEGADDAWFSGPGGRSLWDDPSLARYANATPAQQGGLPSLEEIEAEIRRRQGQK